LDGEIKHFVREFETRRQNEDSMAIQSLLRQQQNAIGITDNIQLYSLEADKILNQSNNHLSL
jgi:hypothetical protein